MDFTEEIQRIAEILDLPTVPSDDQVSQLADVLSQVHDAGYVEGQRHLDERYGVRVEQTIDTVEQGSTIIGYRA